VPLTLIYKDSQNALDAVTLDASISERHGGDVVVPEHPVESGAEISDHVVRRPESLQVDGVLTDYPLESSRGSFTFGADTAPLADAGRARAMYETLEALRDSGTVVEVRTSTRTYENMLIRSLNRTHDRTTSGAIKFTAQLSEVRFAESQTVPVQRTRINAAKKKVSGGKQQGTPADDSTKNKSWLAAGVDKFAGREGVGGPVVPGALKKVPVR